MFCREASVDLTPPESVKHIADLRRGKHQLGRSRKSRVNITIDPTRPQRG